MCIICTGRAIAFYKNRNRHKLFAGVTFEHGRAVKALMKGEADHKSFKLFVQLFSFGLLFMSVKVLSNASKVKVENTVSLTANGFDHAAVDIQRQLGIK